MDFLITVILVLIVSFFMGLFGGKLGLLIMGGAVLCAIIMSGISKK